MSERCDCDRWLFVSFPFVDIEIQDLTHGRQGAAVNHRAIEDLSADVKDQIAGVVTFGDTQNR